jgi:hypothetical protein
LGEETASAVDYELLVFSDHARIEKLATCAMSLGLTGQPAARINRSSTASTSVPASTELELPLMNFLPQ